MASHSRILAWRIPSTEEPGGLQSMGLQRVRHQRATNTPYLTPCQLNLLLLLFNSAERLLEDPLVEKMNAPHETP